MKNYLFNILGILFIIFSLYTTNYYKTNQEYFMYMENNNPISKYNSSIKPLVNCDLPIYEANEYSIYKEGNLCELSNLPTNKKNIWLKNENYILYLLFVYQNWIFYLGIMLFLIKYRKQIYKIYQTYIKTLTIEK